MKYKFFAGVSKNYAQICVFLRVCLPAITLQE